MDERVKKGMNDFENILQIGENTGYQLLFFHFLLCCILV